MKNKFLTIFFLVLLFIPGCAVRLPSLPSIPKLPKVFDRVPFIPDHWISGYMIDTTIYEPPKLLDSIPPFLWLTYPNNGDTLTKLHPVAGSAKDPTWDTEHPNSATIEVITVAEFAKHKQWEDTQWKNRGGEYDLFKENISQSLLKSLYKNSPNTKGHVDYYELSTPLTSRDLANYKEGELYGIDHTPQRFQQKWLRPETKVKNLFLTGQDIVTAGVSAAMMSGVITSSAILKKNLMKQFLH